MQGSKKDNLSGQFWDNFSATGGGDHCTNLAYSKRPFKGSLYELPSLKKESDRISKLKDTDEKNAAKAALDDLKYIHSRFAALTDGGAPAEGDEGSDMDLSRAKKRLMSELKIARQMKTNARLVLLVPG